MSKMRLVILGATGSIGTQTLDVVRMHPDKLEVVALAAGRRVDEMVRYAQKFGCKQVFLTSAEKGTGVEELRQYLDACLAPEA